MDRTLVAAIAAAAAANSFGHQNSRATDASHRSGDSEQSHSPLGGAQYEGSEREEVQGSSRHGWKLHGNPMAAEVQENLPDADRETGGLPLHTPAVAAAATAAAATAAAAALGQQCDTTLLPNKPTISDPARPHPLLPALAVADAATGAAPSGPGSVQASERHWGVSEGHGGAQMRGRGEGGVSDGGGRTSERSCGAEESSEEGSTNDERGSNHGLETNQQLTGFVGGVVGRAHRGIMALLFAAEGLFRGLLVALAVCLLAVAVVRLQQVNVELAELVPT